MENSVELTNNAADNKLTVNEQHHNQIHQHYDVQELYDVQEYGTDAIEGEIAECQWEEGYLLSFFFQIKKSSIFAALQLIILKCDLCVCRY